MKFHSGVVTALLMFALSFSAFAVENDDAAFLAGHGFSASEFDVISTWDEVAPNAPGRFIAGYSLQPRGTQSRVDVYRDSDRLLSDEERVALGISPKHWGPSSASAPATVAPVQPKTVAAAVRPALPEGLRAVLALPPYAPAAKAIAATEDLEKPSNQIGDFRELLAEITLDGKAASFGAWAPAPSGGYVWSIAIQSPGAVGQRIHVRELVLAPGARLTVFDPAEPSRAFAQTESAGDLWLPSIFNEEVALELYAPDDAARDASRLSIDRIVHLYKSPSMPKTNAGACNLDVACYPDWAETALGVCGLGVIATSGALFCTGSLIASNDACAATAPYVLTAHHCVGGQTGNRGADNLEFYWFYQTGSCGGAAPDIANAPRTTGGADYLAGAGGTGQTGGGNDFTFLRMRGAPPVTATYLGWNTTPPAIGDDMVIVHHPWGDYKRISFGDVTNAVNVFASDYIEMTWNNGTTEPGSSGAPLFRADTKQIVAQLWGGRAACDAPLEHDYLGRFSVTYPIIQQYLDPAPNGAGFQSSTYNVSESAPSITVTLSLDRAAPAAGIDVQYTVSEDTAFAFSDFIPASGTAHVNAGEAVTTFAVALADDLHTEAQKRIALNVTSTTCGAVSPTRGAAFIVIQDNDLDTDGDGLSDYDELNGVYGPATDPNAADSDRDGLTDREELFQTYGYTTDPNNADTDGDRAGDFMEILWGTDPTVEDATVDSLRIPWYVDAPAAAAARKTP